MINKILSSVYDHWLIIFSITGFSIVSILIKYFPIVANYKISLWIFVLSIIVVILIIIYLKRDKIKQVCIVLEKPKEKIQDYGRHELFNVNWLIWLGCDEESFSNRRIWADGPFCKKCDYELDDWNYCWFCLICDKKFKIQKNIRSNPREKTIKIFTTKAQKADGLVAQ